MEGVSGVRVEGEWTHQRAGAGGGGISGKEEDAAETGDRNEVLTFDRFPGGGGSDGKGTELVGEIESETHGARGLVTRNAQRRRNGVG